MNRKEALVMNELKFKYKSKNIFINEAPGYA